MAISREIKFQKLSRIAPTMVAPLSLPPPPLLNISLRPCIILCINRAHQKIRIHINNCFTLRDQAPCPFVGAEAWNHHRSVN